MATNRAASASVRAKQLLQTVTPPSLLPTGDDKRRSFGWKDATESLTLMHRLHTCIVS